MTTDQVIISVSALAGLACSLIGIYLVLRRMAMLADAIAHSVLPGLVAAYLLSGGPHLLAGMVGAVAAALLAVGGIEFLKRKGRLREDAAIGLVFPAMFALGVFWVSSGYQNLHIDADAVLFGEIAFAPFDRWTLEGRDMGPKALWILGGLAGLNAAFLALFHKELKLTSFDAALGSLAGFAPGLIQGLLMGLTAVNSVAAMGMVGAILTVSLMVVPPLTASLWTRRLVPMMGLALAIGAVGSGLGAAFALLWDLSIGGSIACLQGVGLIVSGLVAPGIGLRARWDSRRRQRDFQALLQLTERIHHLPSASPKELAEELGWSPIQVKRLLDIGLRQGVLGTTETGYRVQLGR